MCRKATGCPATQKVAGHFPLGASLMLRSSRPLGIRPFAGLQLARDLPEDFASPRFAATQGFDRRLVCQRKSLPIVECRAHSGCVGCHRVT